MKKLLILLIPFFIISGCAFEGNVYVSINWYGLDPANMPATIDTNIPNVPNDPLLIVSRAYYQTLPGTWYFTTNYGGPDYTINVTLVTKEAIAGFENNYYDIICVLDADPYIQQVPAY